MKIEYCIYFIFHQISQANVYFELCLSFPPLLTPAWILVFKLKYKQIYILRVMHSDLHSPHILIMLIFTQAFVYIFVIYIFVPIFPPLKYE